MATVTTDVEGVRSALRERYRVRAKLAVYRRRVERARAIVTEASGHGACAVLFSGGKDSMALLHLASQVLPGVPAYFIDSGAETDWTYEAVAGMRRLGYQITTLYPEHTIIEMAQIVGWRGYDGPHRRPGEWHWRPEDYREVLIDEPARRIVAAGCPVHLVGLRAGESRGRARNRAARGTIYRRADGRLIATPLADWEAADVLAYCLVNDLPLSAEYLQPDDDWREERRTGTALGTSAVTYGRWHDLRTRHPALWQRLVAMFPEMRHDS